MARKRTTGLVCSGLVALTAWPATATAGDPARPSAQWAAGPTGSSQAGPGMIPGLRPYPGAPAPIGVSPTQPGGNAPGMAPAGPGAPGAAGAAGAPGAAAAGGGGGVPFDTGGGATAAALSSGLGGGLGGANSGLLMIGDQGPTFLPPRPPRPPIPTPPQPFSGAALAKSKTVVPWIRSFKIADNQSPVPQDRVFFNFNYFNNVNQSINNRFNAPVQDMQVYRYQLGLEKTFLNGRASIGFRDSINTLSATSNTTGLGGTSTSMGDLDIFTKFVLAQNLRTTAGAGPAPLPFQREGGLLSGGLSVRTPTGPGSFAGAPFSVSYRNVGLQPFVGYFWTQDRFFAQGFEAIDVPLDSRDVVAIYNDIGIGYYLYRDSDPDAFLTMIAPTFETHINVPLTHSDWSNLRDPIAAPTTVDLTYGVNVLFGRNTLFTTAIVTPVTGPRPFDFEVVGMLNIYFGRGSRPGRATPPIVGY